MSSNGHHHSSPTRCKIGYLGRLASEKAGGVFIHMAAQIVKTFPGCKFSIAGSGPLEADLRRLSKVYAVEIDFVGHLERHEVSSYLESLDIFVNPSFANETFCITNIEAMIAGVPIVAVALRTGAMDYFDGSNAALVKHPLHGLAATVVDLLRDPLKLQHMIRSGLETVRERFHPGESLQRYKGVFLSSIEHTVAVGNLDL